MSGNNGISKWIKGNREEQVIDPKTRGTEFVTVSPLLITASVITAAQLLNNEMSFNNTTPSSLSLDTMKNIADFFATKNKIEIGAGFFATFINTDPNNSKTINIPTPGMTFFDRPGATSFTVPAGIRIQVFFEINSVEPLTMVIYTQSFSGMINVVTSKTAAIALPASLAQLVTSGNTVEPPNWYLNYSTPSPPTSMRWVRTAAAASTTTMFLSFPLTGILQKLAANPSSTFTITSCKMYYSILNATSAVTVYPRLTYSSLTPFTTAPGINIVPGTTTFPTTPKGPNAVITYYEDTFTLTTPLTLVDNMVLSFEMFCGFFPVSQVDVAVYGGTVYGNYQYSIL